MAAGANRSQGGFNPRAREGRDESYFSSEWILSVSIHAPARGATVSFGGSSITSDKFQSTRPRGARREIPTLHAAGIRGFNPRAREGRDNAA